MENNFAVWEDQLLKTPAHIIRKRFERLEKYKKENRISCPFMVEDKQ